MSSPGRGLQQTLFLLVCVAVYPGSALLLDEPEADSDVVATFAGLPHRIAALARPFVHYIQNLPQKAREHFHDLREAKPDLAGFTLCDRLESALQAGAGLEEYMWPRREIENYLCQPETLQAYAEVLGQESEERRRLMGECTGDVVPRYAARDRASRWWNDVKASDDFLDLVFEAFFGKLGLPNLTQKTDYHVLARHVPKDQIAPEVEEVLDRILAISGAARPAIES